MPDATTLDEVFLRLREILRPYAPDLVVERDEPGDYQLYTHEARPDGYRFSFGAVQTKKRYVSYHLVPVYRWPELLDPVSPELRRRMQGKSCFNFTKLDDVLVTELAELTDRAARHRPTDR